MRLLTVILFFGFDFRSNSHPFFYAHLLAFNFHKSFSAPLTIFVLAFPSTFRFALINFLNILLLHILPELS